ncbi:hypothetical protein [Spirosoma sp. KUDC1026]|uniref:phage head spike fiber domain-containing protein n=1 Tax=Spirosoma sp. KUDC1026 TaxID=2745947 RepID=UPI00159BA33D|nr:hypothetical protein [Spirosoma sp. KUDC1026]QKZ15183.1 hypothetical protein HU175_22180 [Spirosoma sp. KUDC1026]
MRLLTILFLLLCISAHGQMSVTPVMQGFTPSLVLDFTKGTLPAGLTFTRNSIATRVNASGNIETVANDVPRFDYDPVTLQPRGILIEEARTNLARLSADFDNAVWSKGNDANPPSSVVANVAIGPDGTMSADRFVPGVSGNPANQASFVNSNRIFQEVSSSASTTFTNSIYVKTDAVNTQCAIMVVTSGTNNIISSTTITTSSSWQRISTTGTTNGNRYVFVSSQPVLIWGAQAEVGFFATSYIPTTSSSVTRAAEFCSLSVGSWYNPYEGCWLVRTTIPPPEANYRRIVAYQDDRDFLETYNNGSTGTSAYNGEAGFAKFGTVPTDGFINHAMYYNQSGSAVTRQGLTPITSTRLFGVPTLIYLGCRNTGSGILNAHIAKVVYRPHAPSNSYLQSLTQ